MHLALHVYGVERHRSVINPAHTRVEHYIFLIWRQWHSPKSRTMGMHTHGFVVFRSSYEAAKWRCGESNERQCVSWQAREPYISNMICYAALGLNICCLFCKTRFELHCIALRTADQRWTYLYSSIFVFVFVYLIPFQSYNLAVWLCILVLAGVVDVYIKCMVRDTGLCFRDYGL